MLTSTIRQFFLRRCSDMIPWRRRIKKEWKMGDKRSPNANCELIDSCADRFAVHIESCRKSLVNWLHYLIPRLVAIHEGNMSFVPAPRAFGFVAQGVVNWFDNLVPKRRLVKRKACLMSSCIWEIFSETERYVWSQWRILFGSVWKLVLSRKGVKTLFVECVESCSLPFRIIRLVSFRINFRIVVFIFVFVFRKSIFTENWRNIEFTY